MIKNKLLVEEQMISFSRRAILLGGIQLGILGLVVNHLYKIQVSDAKKYSLLSDSNRFNFSLIPSSRGSIYDREGRILATNTGTFDVEIIPERLKDIQKTLYDLSKLIPLNENEIKSVLNISKKQKSFIPIIIKSNIDRQTISKIAISIPHLPGINIQKNERRIFPQGSLAVHVTGYVGRVSKSEQKENSPELFLPGFRIGKSGIELQYDKLMRGISGEKRLEVNSLGKVIRSSIEKEIIKGKDVNLSLDVELQTKALRRLQAGNDHLININSLEAKSILNRNKSFAWQLRDDRNYINKNKKGSFVLPESGSVVVMDVETGEVIVSVSAPTYDPNKFDPGISASDWQMLSNHPRNPLINKAISGQYPPGSTFKMMVALAALEAGVITSKTKSFCSGHIEVGDMKFHCWKKLGHGSVNVIDAIAQSCDVFFYEIALKTGINNIAKISREFGLGLPTGLNLPGEKGGLIPDRDWKLKEKKTLWRPGETIIAGIGQGYVLVTPMQLALMTARIANGGKKIIPTLIKSEGKLVNNFSNAAISKDNLNIIKKAMENVTLNEFGTGRTFRLGNKGVEMAGKTGTVQVRRISTIERESEEGVIKNEDRIWEWRDHALYVGYAPMEKPKYAISVIVEHGGSGSSKAGPIARDIMEATIQDDPTKFIPKNPIQKPIV
ncbi:MAG: penicillin-binding protein 2 [Candidatus Puniceispirillales bacterium]